MEISLLSASDNSFPESFKRYEPSLSSYISSCFSFTFISSHFLSLKFFIIFIESNTAPCASCAIFTVMFLHSETAKEGDKSRRSSIKEYCCSRLSRIVIRASFSSCFVNGNKMSVVTMLKILWQNAICKGDIAASTKSKRKK